MRFIISWREEQNIIYNLQRCKNFSLENKTRFKNLRRKPDKESEKRTISISDELELLHSLSNSTSISRCFRKLRQNRTISISGELELLHSLSNSTSISRCFRELRLTQLTRALKMQYVGLVITNHICFP